MRSKFLFVILLALLAVTALVSFTGAFSQDKKQLEQEKTRQDRSSLRARALKAKEKGTQKLELSAPIMEYADGVDLDTALSQTTVIVADVLEKHSRLIDSHTIATFYRLRIIETLSRPIATNACCNVPDEEFPPDLPQLEMTEMYVYGIGGTVTLDGVEVSVQEDFGGLLPHYRYLLFVSETPSRKFGRLQLGPAATFKVEPGDNLEVIVNRKSKLTRELEKAYGNSLPKMKAGLQRRRAL